jgi:hypothetical protein
VVSGSVWDSSPEARTTHAPDCQADPIRSDLVLVKILVVLGVIILPLPALVAGCRGALRRPGLSADDPGDRASIIVLITLRLLSLVLVFLLSGITLLSAVGAMIKNVDLHGLVYVFFVLDLLLATLVVLTFGRSERRPRRRRARPARR